MYYVLMHVEWATFTDDDVSEMPSRLLCDRGYGLFGG